MPRSSHVFHLTRLTSLLSHLSGKRPSPSISIRQNEIPSLHALNEARASGSFLIFAYVIMPDHIHIITNGDKKARVILRFVNGIIGRRIIDFLKQQGHLASLEKLRHEEYRRGHRYSLWDHRPNIRLLTSEGMFMQRVHYTHQNPVRAGLVETLKTSSIQASGSGVESHWTMSPCLSILIRSGDGRRDDGGIAS